MSLTTFVITPTQMQALARASFESWMVRHLSEFFAEETAMLESEQMRTRISAALEQARWLGFSTETEWCRYIDLTFVLGPNFDRDPSMPWAAEILTDDRLTDCAMRMELLFEAVQVHCAGVDEVKPIKEADRWVS